MVNGHDMSFRAKKFCRFLNYNLENLSNCQEDSVFIFEIQNI